MYVTVALYFILFFFLMYIATKRWMNSLIKGIGLNIGRKMTSNNITSLSKELGTINFRFYFKTLPMPPASPGSGT